MNEQNKTYNLIYNTKKDNRNILLYGENTDLWFNNIIINI